MSMKWIHWLRELSVASLMEVYEEGNRENGAEQYPEESEARQLMLAEQDFYQYLREVFFQTPGAVYAIWEEAGRYASALRLEPYRDGLLLAALETRPDSRRRGYGTLLIQAVLAAQEPGQRVYSHVHKRNLPSLGLHEKCGFQRIAEYAAYLDGSVNNRCCTFLWKNEE